MKVEMRLRGINGIVDTLNNLPAEIVSKRGGPVKSALRKGAVVILKAEQQQLRSVMGHHTQDEEKILSSGLLLKNIVATRGKAPIGYKGERYLVRVKRKAYRVTDRGHLRTEAGATNTVANAQRLEYGTSKQPAEPFIRPAFLANAARAIATIERETIKGVERVIRTLFIQNKGR